MITQVSNSFNFNFERTTPAQNKIGGDNSKKANNEFSDEEQKQVEELQKRDREVKQHEQAHLSAGAGIVVSGPTYQYQRGPDGNQYAIGGEVQIDTSPVPDDPEATIRKMQQVQAAALAPAEPSSQDRSVASNAAKIQAKARVELTQKQMDERKSIINGDSSENRSSDIFSAYMEKEQKSFFDMLF